MSWDRKFFRKLDNTVSQFPLLKMATIPVFNPVKNISFNRTRRVSNLFHLSGGAIPGIDPRGTSARTNDPREGSNGRRRTQVRKQRKSIPIK